MGELDNNIEESNQMQLLSYCTQTDSIVIIGILHIEQIYTRTMSINHVPVR